MKQQTRKDILQSIAYWQEMLKKYNGKIFQARCEFHLMVLENKLNKLTAKG